MKPLKGRAAPAATIDHAANLREHLGRAAFNAATGSDTPGDTSWETANATRKEYWRIVGAAVLAAITGGQRGQRGDFTVASIYGYDTKQPYVNVEVSLSPMQISPAKAREMALLLLECADAAESDAVLIGYAKDVLGLSEIDAAKLLAQFRDYRTRQLGKAADSA